MAARKKSVMVLTCVIRCTAETDSLWKQNMATKNARLYRTIRSPNHGKESRDDSVQAHSGPSRSASHPAKGDAGSHNILSTS
jgi:hypothetical protein